MVTSCQRSSYLESQRERHSVARTNLGILGMAAALSSMVGIQAYLLIQLAVIGDASWPGLTRNILEVMHQRWFKR